MAKLSMLEREADKPPAREAQLALANSKQTIPVLIRLLSVKERQDSLKAAKAAYGVSPDRPWNETDQECLLELWVQIVSRAAMDADSPDDPFASPEKLRTSYQIGQENIQYLYEIYQAFEEDVGFRGVGLTRTEALVACYRLSEGDDSPLDRMRLGTQRAFMRFTGALLWSFVKNKSHSTLDGDIDIKASNEPPKKNTQKSVVLKKSRKRK
jgi:hypothetical protein